MLKKPLILGAVALASIGGLTGCEHPDAPSNPDNFPSRFYMASVATKWHKIIYNNRPPLGPLGGSVGCTATGDVSWNGPQSRWDMSVSCSYTLWSFVDEKFTTTKDSPFMKAHADWTKDWITGSHFQN